MTDLQTPGSTISRRAAIGTLGALGLGAVASGAQSGTGTGTGNRAGSRLTPLLTAEELGYDEKSGRYTLPKLPYDYDALEPVIDAQTMQIHHGKHHQGYVNGLNKALDKLADIRSGSGDAGLIKHWSRELSFHGSGHVNHAIFWQTMAPKGKGGGGEPKGLIADRLKQDLGGYDGFKTHFAAAAKAVEGSGWGWLVYEPTAGRLLVLQGEKQQNMMMTGVVPLLGIDVWEHAYYLKYQNRRAEYVDAFFDIINWTKVNELLQRAMS
ncbi:MAG: superoxide dismutase [Phycisphaerales bacterium JB050]